MQEFYECYVDSNLAKFIILHALWNIVALNVMRM